MPTADRIAHEASQLPEHLAAEVLDFIHFLQNRERLSAPSIAVDAALEMLEHPPLNLGGHYLSREACHERAQLR